MPIIHRIPLLFVLSFVISCGALAQALVKPLPQADTSKLPAETINQLTDLRVQFEKQKINLVGQTLAEAYAVVGAGYARAGLIDVAVVAFYDAAQLSPTEGRWVYLQGVLADSKKQAIEARSYYEQAFKLDSDYFPIRFRLATAKIQQGDLEAARRLMSEFVTTHQNLAAPYSLLGEIALSQKRYADAIDALKKAQALEPAANKLNALLADAYTGLGDKTAAQQARADAGEQPIHMGDPLVAGITPGGNSGDELVRAKMVDPNVGNDPVNQAMMYYSNHQYDSARKALDQVLKTKGSDVRLLSLYARIDAESGDLPKAKQRLQIAMNIDAKNSVVLLTQGVIAEIGGDENAAADAYAKALIADVDLTEAHHLLGNIFMRRGKYAQAAEQYRPSANHDRPDAEANARLAAAEILAGNCANAFNDISVARVKFPQNGLLAQIYVRVTSTCDAVRGDNIAQAIDIAKKLYVLSPTADNSEAIALVMAAQGKFEDAMQFQTQASFEAVREHDKTTATLLNEFLKDYRAKKMPERAWPSDHPYFKPPRLTPLLNLG